VDDCQEISANNYTSTWNVGIHSTVADSSTTYQRNSELTQIHTRQISCDGTIISVGDDVIDDRHHIGSIALQTYFFAIKSAEICTNLASTQIGGTVFEDWNFDGIMNQSDTVGVQGIEVIAYDCNNNAISTTYTDANGNYRFDGLIANQDYRIEFSLPASIDNWANPTPAGTDNGTTVQFLLAGNCANLGVARPSDYCQVNPRNRVTGPISLVERVDWLSISDVANLLSAKGQALGYIEKKCDLAPIEIGNYVWKDINRNGIQDACEPALSTVILELYNAQGEIVAIDTTDNQGQYYFNTATISAYTNHVDTDLKPDSIYYVVIKGAVDSMFANNSLTIANEQHRLTVNDATLRGHANSDLLDSDGMIGNSGGTTIPAINGFPFIMVTTGTNGTVNHSLDFGFVPAKNYYDYGDLPDDKNGTANNRDYETYDSTGGPNHLIIAGLFLGDTVDLDTDGMPDIQALGDDMGDGYDDEDGIELFSSMNLVPGGVVRFAFKATNTTMDTAYLKAWIDWNGDGDFDESNELVTDYKDHADGVFPDYLAVNIPTNALKSTVGFRIRLSNANNMTPYGRVNSGEVEDYLLSIDCPQTIHLPVVTTIKKK